MVSKDDKKIRLGMLCFVLYGVMAAVGLPFRGPVIIPGENPELWAEVALLSTHDLAWAILLPALVIQLFGFMAYWGFMKDRPQGEMAFWGMVLSVAGNGLFLPSTGILAFADPQAAQMYQAGMTEQALNIASAGVSGALSGTILAGSGIMLLVGSILIGITLWKSPLFPKWTAVVYIFHAFALTLAVTISYTVEQIGGLLILLVAVVMTRIIWRETSTP
tara:strand:- start:171579 stop:172235 length:657 start_codon:yes stop_codon:yes gene_type:complete